MSTTTATKGESTVSSASGARVYNARHTLDSLAEMSSAELENLYRSTAAPTGLEKVKGKPRGRMLTVDHTDGTPAFSAIKAFAAMNVFPWDGKSFSYSGGSKGAGINRVKLLVANFDWFPFETEIVPSAIDGKPCVFLQYEQPGNPFFIAKIHDEIREVSPGVWMGPAMLKRDGQNPLLILWFAVDFNQSR